MTAIQLLLVIIALACALSFAMSLAWMAEQRTGNSGWIDTVWTFGVGAVGVAGALVRLPAETVNPDRQWLVAGVMVVWSLRLGTHIAQRSSGRPDDPRYAKLRSGWGEEASWQMWLLLQKQALVSIPLVFSVCLAAHNPATGIRTQDALGLLILAVAIGGETLADRQLRRFHRENPKHICDVGLWKWSRHPNYFFEWLGWLAYPIIAVEFSGGFLLGWLAFSGPACMYWLLVYVSGIPPLEEHMLSTRGDAFRAYRARTNAFFPLPPGV